MTNVRGSMEAVTFGDGVVKCLIIWRWGPLSMVVCFVFMGDSVQIYKVLIRCVCFFFWFWHLSATFQIPTDPLRDIIVFLRSVQSTENRKSHTMDLCVTSYGPTLTVNISHWASFLLISPTRFVPFFFLFVLLFHTRYPRLGIITSRSRLSFWCRYNEKLCS